MTDQPCLKCRGKGEYMVVYDRAPGDAQGNVRIPCDCTRTDPASLPNDAAKVRETPEAFVSEQPCLCLICGEPGIGTPNHKPWCEKRRASPILGYHEKTSVTDNAGSVPKTVDNAHQAVREGDERPKSLLFPEWHANALAAKDAEIERLSEETARALTGSLVMREVLKNRDTLIRQLKDALRDATKYVEATHAMIKGAVGHDNIVLPVLQRCQEAIAAAERHEKGER